ncbi:MAG: sarcosine oxidase subunit gamma [Halocynthiibacter sp.]
MHKLKAITPLGGCEPHVDTFDGVTISENPSRALVALTLRSVDGTAYEAAFKGAFGFQLPDVSRAVLTDDLGAFWIGPNSWMIDADYDAHANFAQDLKDAVSDAASVVEQTDGWCRFDVDGASVVSLFERLCAADVARMDVGHVTRTTIHHLSCFLWCIDTNTFAVIGPRSSARSLHHALTAAAKSVC